MQHISNKPGHQIRYLLLCVCLLMTLSCFLPHYSSAQEDLLPAEDAAEAETNQVELNGDQVSYDVKENKMVATGNVEIKRGDITLLADKVEFYRDTHIAFAEGNVVLIRPDGKLEGDKLKFNFKTMTGGFDETKFVSDPFYGTGESIERVGENHMRINKGYITTCDLDKPHYKLGSKKVDIYPGEKAVARNVRLLVGKLPVLFIPKFTQDLTDKKPVVTYTPGYDKDWGAFLLSNWRYKLNENVKGVVHLDYRQRKDFAWGIDMNYDTVKYGSGIIRTYYMNERTVDAKHFFEERLTPTIERERFKVEWRHKWDVDENTDAIWQYYKLSDKDILKDYFEREFDEDSNPESYFLLTRLLPKATLSVRGDVRVNRFVSATERLPEVTYDMPSLRLLGSNFYLRNKSIFSNFVKKSASPSEVRTQTMRFDTDNELNYPMKLSIFEVTPFAGGKQTFYSKTKTENKYDVIRGVFRTGANVSTKFYRIFDVTTNKFGLEINRLRHIITPSVGYLYQHDPTVPASQLDTFDGIDGLTREHRLSFSLENKLQTKRQGKSVDLARIVLGSNFNLKEDTDKGGFTTVTSDIDITPFDWLSMYFETTYNPVQEKLKVANLDLYLRDPDGRWHFNLGKRFHDDVDDQLTTEVGFKLNQKWKFKVYDRFDLDTGTLKEQEYSFRRDMHAWFMDISFNETRGEGTEIWLVFTMKEFPDIGFDFGTSFNKRKPGSQLNPND